MAKTKVVKKAPKGRLTSAEGVLGGTFNYNKKKLQQKSRIKRVSWRDEQIEGKGVSDTPEFEDPAILLVRRDVAKIRYTKDELLKFRDAPLSKKKPDFFDEVSPAILDPERWNFDKKKSESQSEGGGGPRSGPEGAAPAEQPNNRRRVGDPRERVRKENDGIVLSPQRRSFNSGCFVPVRVDASVVRHNRSHSPLGPKNDGPHMGIRDIQSGSRRIGSGRIMRDSWDFNNEKPDASGSVGGGDGEYFSRGGPSQRNNNERDDKYERRGFGRDFDAGGRGDRENNNKEPPPSSRRNGRFDRRRVDHREQEEPEWFSGGPISQNDTIELRGFEESDKPGKKKLSPSRVKRAKEWSKKKTETQQQNSSDDKVESKEPVGRSTPTLQVVSESGGEQPKKKVEKDSKEEPAKEAAVKTPEENKVGAVATDQSFNFDDILKCDSIPGLLTNGICNDVDTNTKSRFSRWFKQDSPEKIESRRSSLHDDHHIKDLLKDISETSVTIPGDSEAYFAPISPAANTGGIIGGKRNAHAQQQHSQPINIMEMLQRGKQQHQQHQQQQHVDAAAKQHGMAGKILSLDELEAKMRKNAPDRPAGSAQKHQQQQKPDEEMAAAFKKLLAQAQAGGHPATSNGPISKAPPMSLLEMLNHSQQQDEAARLVGPSSHLLGPASPNISHHHHGGNDLTLKLQQAQLQQQKQQMDMLNKLINATTTSVHPSQMRTSPLHDMGMQQSRDLLNRPEAQAILHGLKRGEITTQHLYQQLSNPALQPRHREMLMTILKMQSTGYGPSPRVLSPVPPHHMFQQQQQQLRVSPLPPNAMHQRIPSPRELQVHTQNILQRALIKKKLEEQQENYRKKQEMQRGQSPNTQGPSKSVSSPTPLAFTPTSVLRKMTADKDDGKENKSSIDGKIPPGRPLTGVRPQPVQPQGQQWNQSYASVKHPGRPIVKANNYQTQTAEQFFSQHQQQQQQQRMFNQPPPVVSGQRKPGNVAVSGSQFGSSQGVAQSQYASQQYSTNQQFTQQQLRAQHQHRPANQQPPQQQPSAIQQQQQRGQQQQLGFQQQQQQGGQTAGPAWQQFFSNAQSTRSGNPAGRSGSNDGGDLSPTTTNQLARWFSPDLLERARGGELPSTAGLAQHALSLEELERQTAPPAVHN